MSVTARRAQNQMVGESVKRKPGGEIVTQLHNDVTMLRYDIL